MLTTILGFLVLGGLTALAGTLLLVRLLVLGCVESVSLRSELLKHLMASLLVSTSELLLLVVFVDKALHGLSISDGLGLSVLLDGEQSDVVLGTSHDLLSVTETGVEAFLLGDLQDGEVLTALTASKDAGNQGTL